MRRYLAILSASIGAIMTTTASAEPIVVSEVSVPDEVVVDGQILAINGAGVRKRAFFKTDVIALYVQKPTNNMRELVTEAGAKRISIVALRDLPGSAVSRHFISDFQAAATYDEFATLVSEVGQIGQLYASIHQINKGDSIVIDWIPGKGIHAAINGRALRLPESGGEYMNSPAMFGVLLQMYAGSSLITELQQNMLGLSKSMRDNPKVSPPSR